MSKHIDRPSVPYDEYISEKLRKDDEFAAAYLAAALEEDTAGFLMAVRRLIDAKGIQKTWLAKESGLNRENLYRVLSENGNPELATVVSLMKALGYRLEPVPIRTAS